MQQGINLPMSTLRGQGGATNRKYREPSVWPSPPSTLEANTCPRVRRLEFSGSKSE